MLSFASKAYDIVDIIQSDISGSIDDVIYNLEEFNYTSRTGLVITSIIYSIH